MGGRWWTDTPPATRLKVSLLCLAVLTLVLLASAYDPHGALDWAMIVLAPLYYGFFGYQIWRALKARS